MPVQASAGRVSISGVTDGGVSKVVDEREFGPLTAIPGMPSVLYQDLFAVDVARADLTADVAAPTPGTFTVPQNGGHVVRLLEFLPDPPGYDVSSGRHATETLDHVVVVQGEIVCLFDEGEVILRAGDVLVQRGVQHAWSNRSDQPCRLLAVILDASSAR